MRNAFVVLVSLCIGLASGFIVPSGDSKDNSTSNEQKKLTTDIYSGSTKEGHANELPDNRNDIDENDLYEHAADKQNNQSERAFIYINQKYKKPSLHQYFRLSQQGPELSRSFQLPPPLPQSSMRRLNEPCKSNHVHVNSYFDGYDFPDKALDIASYFVQPTLIECIHNKETHKNKYKEIARNYYDNERLQNYNKIANEQRDYIELLKSPLLRPLNRGSVKPKYDGNPIRNAPTDFFKRYQRRKQLNTRPNILVDEWKKELPKKYGFDRPYVQHPAYKKNDIERLNEVGYKGDFSMDATQNFDKLQDEEKLLDQYLKDTLELDQVTSNENAVVTNGCCYHHCILHSEKTSSSAGRHTDIQKLKCKCGPDFNSKQNISSIPKERPQREQIQSYESNVKLKPSDITTYYEDILTEDSSETKHNYAQHLNLISKLNSLYL